jgi:eukaryotic-like serine/threonine-protein kinase
MRPEIDARRWSQIRAAFDELVDLDARSRSERMALINTTDPVLRKAIDELLAADADVDNRLAHVDLALTFATHVSADAVEHRDPDPLKLAGRIVSHFRVHEPLAVGGMGVVYRAEDTQLHRMIALKFPLPAHHFDRNTKERFLHEARSVGSLDHPNICSIYEAGESDDGQLFLAMPLYDGETLKARLAREGALSATDAIAIAIQIATGLGAAHRSGIVHRDAKPANVMLLRDGSVKVLDFGVAKAQDLTFTGTRARVGTVSYMAPEQIQGRPVDARADQWALGIILYEMLSGRRPFAGDYDVTVALAIVHTEPVALTELGLGLAPELAAIVTRLLRKDPAARYTTIADVVSDLTAVERGETVIRPTLGTRMPHTRAVVIALPLLLSVAIGAWLVSRGGAAATKPAQTLAILPFRDLSADTGSRYLAAGLGDAIATDLSRIRSVVVPSNYSTDDYLDTTKPVTQIGKELAATALLTGRVARKGHRLQVDVTLFDARTGTQLWMQRYHRPVTDMLTVERSITSEVVRMLDIDLSKAERATLARVPTTDARAYDLYLRARDLELRGSPAELRELSHDRTRDIQSLYARARDIDPNFALARARLALTQMYGALQYDSTTVRFDQVRAEADAALRLQPGLAEAHEAIAAYWGPGRGESAKAVEHLKLALGGFPNSAEYHNNLGTSYRRLGRWVEAVAEYDSAMRLDPRYAGPAANAAFTLGRLRRYEESFKAWDRAILLEPRATHMKSSRGFVFLRWRGTVDSLDSAMRGASAWDPDGMGTWARYTVANIRRRHIEALNVLKVSHSSISQDPLLYRPHALLRAQTYDALRQTVRARASYEAARALLADSSAAHPNDPRMRVAIGLAYAGLGHHDDASREARYALTLAPLAKSPAVATAAMGGAAEVFARAGELTASLELLELLLAMPAGREVSVALLRVDPAFDPLRRDPRFEQMLRRFSVD